MSLPISMIHSDVEKLSKTFGDSFFVLDTLKVADNALKFTNAFKKYYNNFQLAYSYKTNYIPEVCKILNSLGVYAEVVSEMEYWLAKKIGVYGDNIIYNGPYKSNESFISAAKDGAIINIDSHRDLEILDRLAGENLKNKIKIAIRCNFEIDGGFASRFGFDVSDPAFPEIVKLLQKMKCVELLGVHCHFPHRSAKTYKDRVDGLIKIVRKFFNNSVKYINIGGGYYSDMPVSMSRTIESYSLLEDYACIIGTAMLDEFGDGDASPVLYAEPGTAIVADTMSFYSRIISKKKVGSKYIATASGSIFNISPTARAKNLPMTLIAADRELDSKSDVKTDVAGYTCIEGDFLSMNQPYEINVNDFVRFDNVGSYSVVMKPPFILPGVAILSYDGVEMKIIKERQTHQSVFDGYVF